MYKLKNYDAGSHNTQPGQRLQGTFPEKVIDHPEVETEKENRRKREPGCLVGARQSYFADAQDKNAQHAQTGENCEGKTDKGKDLFKGRGPEEEKRDHTLR